MTSQGAGHHDHDHAHHGHDHDHDHDHHHHGHSHHGHGHAGHHHGPASYDRAFAIGIALNLGFVIAELTYGFASNSLALIADAGHNFSDVIGLLLAWLAAALAKKRASPRHSYGFGRTTILASLTNAVVLLVCMGAMAWEAALRFAHPEPVAEGTVVWVAALGILINGSTAAMFMAGSKGDINIRGAFLHMASDALVSLGVVVSALVMQRTGWTWLDPAVSIAIALLITVGTWGLLQESLAMALDAVPAHIDRAAVEAYLRGLEGVTTVHDLHIWPLSTSSVSLTAHLVKPGATVDDGFLAGVAHHLNEKFKIDHVTIQIERADAACDLTEAH